MDYTGEILVLVVVGMFTIFSVSHLRRGLRAIRDKKPGDKHPIILLPYHVLEIIMAILLLLMCCAILMTLISDVL